MPSIKDFDKKKKKGHKKTQTPQSRPEKNETAEAPAETLVDVNDGYDLELASSDQPSTPKSQQRRPSKSDHVETSQSQTYMDSEPAPESYQSFNEPQSFELQFPGSFIFKEKIPKAFDLAQRIVGDWVNDGKFEALPVGHPLAQILASKALVKAKNLEKNVLNSTPVTLAKIGLEYAKSKIKR